MNSIEKGKFFRAELAKLQCLAARGYVDISMVHVPSTKLIPEGYLINFKNQNSRSIDIKIFSLEDKEIVAVNIANTEAEESFSLINWLKYKGLFKSYDEFRLTAYAGDFSERVQSFLLRLSEILCSEQLNLVLIGKNWESIPFDWAGMR